MPISRIIFHAVLSMMHTLSYPALGHILIWRQLHAVGRRLLKSGQASIHKATRHLNPYQYTFANFVNMGRDVRQRMPAKRKQTGQLRLLTTGQRQCPLQHILVQRSPVDLFSWYINDIGGPEHHSRAAFSVGLASLPDGLAGGTEVPLSGKCRRHARFRRVSYGKQDPGRYRSPA